MECICKVLIESGRNRLIRIFKIFKVEETSAGYFRSDAQKVDVSYFSHVKGISLIE